MKILLTRTFFLTFVVLVGACFELQAAANAVSLVQESAQFIKGTTLAARPELSGRVLEDRVRPFNFDETLSPTSATKLRGTFEDEIVQRKGSKTLDFYFRIKNDKSSTQTITRVDRLGFGNFSSLDVDYLKDKTRKFFAHATVARFFENHPNRHYRTLRPLSFDFSQFPIKPGQESTWHFIGASATSYRETLPGRKDVAVLWCGSTPVYRPIFAFVPSY